MITEILSQLNFSKNEARIYESLLSEGELSVSKIAARASINRRNVYDSLNRLIEKGVVFEILQGDENRYQAVDPKKLMELLKEKEQKLEQIMPELEAMYEEKRHDDATYVYRGIEGWKNYMRELLRIGGPVYTIGAKGAWSDQRISTFYEQFAKEAKRKNIQFYCLYDDIGHKAASNVLEMSENKFFSSTDSTSSAIEILKDRVIIFSNIGGTEIDEGATYTVIVNQKIAESFTIWFKLLWDATAPKNKRIKDK